MYKTAKVILSHVDATVNHVRARAGQPAVSAVTFAQWLDERRKEFVDEGLRWLDLQRSGESCNHQECLDNY